MEEVPVAYRRRPRGRQGVQGPEIRCAAARWTRGNASHEPVLRGVEMGGW